LNKELSSKTIKDLSSLIEKKQVSPVELAEDILSQINDNKEVNAYIEVYAEDFMESAKEAESEIMHGNYLGPLHGIPIGIKDNIYIKNKKATIGSKIHKDFVPDYNATIINKLSQKGAIIPGKLNMHEYAWGATNDNPHFGACRNPWDLSRIPGGSSGGSAAAVAANLAIASIGTDTAGSLRIPASACGIVSIKPTYGKVSKYGCYPLAWSFDHIGPMTKTVYDSALLLQSIEGYDKNDLNSVKTFNENYLDSLEGDMNNMVIGIEEDYFFNNIDSGVEQLVRNSILELEKMGARVKKVKLPSLENIIYASTILISVEASSIHHNRLISRPQDIGKDVRNLFQLGEVFSATEYLKAQRMREQISIEFKDIFEKVDVLISPTLPFTPPLIGQSIITINDKKEKFSEHISRLTRPANLTGLPALSIPCGIYNGLPVGLQIMGGSFQELKLFKVATALEKMQLLKGKQPKVAYTL